VEFSYPPLLPDESHDSGGLPEQWRYLPFLALPDGAHNYQEDAKALKVRLADVTRETVQKSVCVLSRVPLYGLLQAKLQLITHAYFEEKDFSQIDILKVLFYVSPVNTLVGTLMTVLSLFPGMIEHGLADSSHYRPKSSVSDELGSREETTTVTTTVTTPSAEEFVSVSASDVADAALELVGEELSPAVGDAHLLKPPARSSPDSSESDWETLDPSVLEEARRRRREDLREDLRENRRLARRWRTFRRPLTPSRASPSRCSLRRGRGRAGSSRVWCPVWRRTSMDSLSLSSPSSVQNSERGKKIGNAMMTTSRNVVQTGKAVGQSVGGALTSAKSAMSSWFSTLAQPPALTTPPGPEGDHREGQ
ncbi:hypothetical protein CRUP_005428, partial [Coryphaenoides rupestris]